MAPPCLAKAFLMLLCDITTGFLAGRPLPPPRDDREEEEAPAAAAALLPLPEPLGVNSIAF